MAVIALALVAIRQTGTPSPAASGSGTAAPAAIPRYYATVLYDVHTNRSGPLIVGDDLTGKVIATVVSPPGVVFTYARGMSDDRTFVVQAAAGLAQSGLPPFSWYLLHIAPGSAHPYQLTKLPVKLPDSSTIARSFALSPDGRELAVESTRGNTKASPVITLAIYSVSTDAQLRAWTTPTQPTDDVFAHTLSWLEGGRQLVFNTMTGSGHLQLRTLDVTGAGTDLMGGSRALFTADTSATSTCRCRSRRTAEPPSAPRRPGPRAKPPTTPAQTAG